MLLNSSFRRLLSSVTIQDAPTLLERERELQEIGQALSEAQHERGQLVLVEGPAGLGKTSLLRTTLRMAARSGFACLRARASELERGFSYGCVRQLLEPAIARTASAERDQLFEGAAALAKPLFADSSAPPSSPSADCAFSMLHGLYWLLNNITRHGPVALCVDDLHWSDAESLRFLCYLAPRLDGLPVAVLASARTHENVTADLARLFAGPETKVLRLEPLSIEATAALCEIRLGTQVAHDFAVACQGATGGNPFFLETLLREARDLRFLTDASEAARVRRFGPAAVGRAVLLRLAGAPASATALVRAIAVLGDGASVAEAGRLAEIPADDAARVADLLVALAILKTGEGLEFAHAIVRQAVYADIGTHERTRAHAHAARILAEHGASDERVATQIAEAEPSGEPGRVELLRRVAADALARGAPAAAVAWLRRALAEPPPPESHSQVLLELGGAELRVAAPEAADHLVAAVRGIRHPDLLTTATLHLANALSMRGDADRAVAAIDSAILRVQPGNPELALILEAELAAKSHQASREARMLAATRLMRHSGLKGVTPGERLTLASVAFEQARASESAREAVRHIERALAAGGLRGEQQPDVVGIFYALVIGLLDTDALDLAARFIEQALADARRRGSIPATAFLIAHRGWFSLRAGAVADAEADALAALELLTTHDIRHGARFALALLLEAQIECGEIEAAGQALIDGGLGTQIPPGLANNNLLEARGQLRLAQGRTREALDDLIQFGRRDQLWGAANHLASRWRSRACLALAATGDSEGALHMAAEELERARRWGAASGIGIALRAMALVEGSTPSIDRLSEAAAVLQHSQAKLEYARVLTDLGAAQRRANSRAAARTTLQDALDWARRCGARALAERAETELRAAGGRSRAPTAAGISQLTVSERRVAELAAKGHSNPEIAQRLFVTRKTIETHLGHIYSKLGIAGRAELGRALERDTPAAAG
jgi:DNA-binding CsgD family transcriptional regulator/Tfp pilus assembly protein PilF